MKKITIAAALIFTLGFVVTSCNESKKQEAQEEVQKEVKESVEKEVEATEHEHSDEMAMATYQCEMKCEGDKTYDKPGKCPVCKMDLKKVEKDGDEGHDDGDMHEEHNEAN
jgi:transcription initiation factor IIE alpha subunit